MDQLDRYQSSITDNRSSIVKWDGLLQESTHDEVEGTERIVTTLYAKPSTGKPFLTLTKLKKRIYEETSVLSLHSYLLFSDIGQAVWNAALEINRNTTIGLGGSSLLEEDKSWQVTIKNPDLTTLINSIRFRPLGKYTSAFYISIEVSSKPATLMAFVKAMIDTLNRKPWEDEIGELDWMNFTKKTFMSRKEVIEQWALLSNLPELLPESLKDANKPVCMRCKKSMENEWILCPFCGKPSRDSTGRLLPR